LTLRITDHDEDETKVLKLDGNLTHEEVAVLRDVAEGRGAAVCLDLTHLLSVDREGIAALRQLRDRGALLQGVSPYIALLLDGGER
jgi:ABC-type transporter Mla MlaB component